LLQSITPAGRPYDLSLSPDQSTIYTVVNPVTSSQQPSIALIDTSSLAIRSTIALPAGTYPFWSAISPDGSTLYVSNNAAQYGTAPNTQSSYLVIDTASEKVTGNINVNAATSRPAVTPDGSLLLYLDGSAAMSAIDTATMTPSWTAGTSGVFSNAGFPPPHIVFSIGGQYAYALGTAFQTGGTYNAIFQVDTFQGKVVNTIPVGTSTSLFSDLAISGDGSMLLAADTSSGKVYLTHLPDNKPMGSFQGVSLTKISQMILFIAQ
jgi:dipeptidyl aminopeptidase/acylaminoacyl peptidase